MTQVNTILEELRKELGKAMQLVVTSCGDVREHWEGRRDALIRAIDIVEKAATDPADMIDEIIKIVRHVTDHYEHEIAALEGRIRALERAPIDKSPRETIRRIVREEVRSVLADTAHRMKDPEL